MAKSAMKKPVKVTKKTPKKKSVLEEEEPVEDSEGKSEWGSDDSMDDDWSDDEETDSTESDEDY